MSKATVTRLFVGSLIAGTAGAVAVILAVAVAVDSCGAQLARGTPTAIGGSMSSQPSSAARNDSSIRPPAMPNRT